MLQHQYGCEIDDVETKADNPEVFAYSQYAYDGVDYISLNDDLTGWTASDEAAQETQKKWEASNKATELSNYLKVTCKALLLKLYKNTRNITGK